MRTTSTFNHHKSLDEWGAELGCELSTICIAHCNGIMRKWHKRRLSQAIRRGTIQKQKHTKTVAMRCVRYQKSSDET